MHHTREKLVDSAEAYYRETGISPANISLIAKRAAVQRLTLYRHFPNDDALLRAVLERWRARYSWPMNSWSVVADPRQRTRVTLDAIYRYYADAEPVLSLLSSARDRNAAVGSWLKSFDRQVSATRDQLTDGWGVAGRPHQWLAALISHALEASTWRSLVRQGGLASSDAARLMARSVADIARDPYA